MPEVVARQALASFVIFSCIGVGVLVLVTLGPSLARKILEHPSGLTRRLIRVVTLVLSLFIVAVALAVSRGLLGIAGPWRIVVSLVLPSFLLTFAALALIWAGAVGQAVPVLAPWPLRALAAAATGLAAWLTLGMDCPGPVCLEGQAVALAGIVLVVHRGRQRNPGPPKTQHRRASPQPGFASDRPELERPG
ncbi:MAG: hypothetical protein FJZ01_16085 [Candidatus Sericytochromatia bacterium]|nr:hypothetical protein [Candidatus Tanganyikabacteria bacterium]